MSCLLCDDTGWAVSRLDGSQPVRRTERTPALVDLSRASGPEIRQSGGALSSHFQALDQALE